MPNIENAKVKLISNSLTPNWNRNITEGYGPFDVTLREVSEKFVEDWSGRILIEIPIPLTLQGFEEAKEIIKEETFGFRSEGIEIDDWSIEFVGEVAMPHQKSGRLMVTFKPSEWEVW